MVAGSEWFMADLQAERMVRNVFFVGSSMPGG
jgi:hypothetical protein